MAGFFLLGSITLITIPIFRWMKNQPKPYDQKTAIKLCWKEVNEFMRDPASKGILDGRYDWANKKTIKTEAHPGQFTTIVDIRCEWDPGQQQGNLGKIYGSAYILTRGTAEAPPKLDSVGITKGYRFDASLK